jgi:hypothetical protein
MRKPKRAKIIRNDELQRLRSALIVEQEGRRSDNEAMDAVAMRREP